jgi:phospholipid/cholesterol/gamma-HCH transport system ATP-binding protein
MKIIDSNTPNTPIIEIKNLGTCFDSIWVHRHLNLNIYSNKIVTIIGSSGCGKTTLMRSILMLQPIAEGEIYIAAEKISNYNIEDQKTKFMLSKIGVMFQHGALFSSLTVLENVMFPLMEYTNFSKTTIEELAAIKLKLTGLPETAYKKYPKEISGGMLKRVALARALALDPKVLFLDEPTTGLDPNSASALDDLILSLKQQLGLTVIMITHDLDSIWGISDELVYIGDKHILFHDSVANAANNKDIPELYEYFNGIRGKIKRHKIKLTQQ